MTYVVTENCIKCKYMDCVEACPVDCFYEGESFLVINPDECIDCGVCEPECPADAIFPDSEPAATAEWLELNARLSRVWPNITHKGNPPDDADAWNGAPGKKAHLTTSSHASSADIPTSSSNSSPNIKPTVRMETLPWRPR